MKETLGNDEAPTVVAVDGSVFLIDFFYDTLFKQKQLKHVRHLGL